MCVEGRMSGSWNFAKQIKVWTDEMSIWEMRKDWWTQRGKRSPEKYPSMPICNYPRKEA